MINANRLNNRQYLKPKPRPRLPEAASKYAAMAGYLYGASDGYVGIGYCSSHLIKPPDQRSQLSCVMPAPHHLGMTFELTL
jgi:hypothetical protein